MTAAVRAPRPARSILFLNHNFRNRGTFFRNFHLARALADRGWEATVWTVSPERRLRGVDTVENGVRIWETPQWTVPRRLAESGCCGWDIASRCVRIAREIGGFDVIFVSDHLFNVSLPFFFAQWLTRGTGKPFVTVADWADLFTMGGLHEEWAGGVTKPLYLLERHLEITTKARADLCTVISRSLGERVLRCVPGIAPGQILHLPSGCDATTPHWESVRDARAEGPALDWREGEFVIGRISSRAVFPRTELLALLAAGRRFRELHAGQRATLLWVGPPLSSAERAELTTALDVRETGFVPPGEVSILAGCCDLFLLIEEDTAQNRSRNPTRLTSYLAAGRAIALSSFSDSAPDLAAHGAVLLWDDPTTLPKGLDQVFTDPAVRLSLGAAARRAAETALSWPNLAASLEGRLLSLQPSRPDAL